MKKLFLLASIACMALFTSCDKMGVPHTGDDTGNLYGIWRLTTKTIETKDSEGSVITDETDFDDVHFYLVLNDFPIPHAIAKEGSLSDWDLDDVDVDGSKFSFNADQKKISFNSVKLSLIRGKKSMLLWGTFDVVELSSEKFVIKQTLINTTTFYSFTKEKDK